MAAGMAGLVVLLEIFTAINMFTHHKVPDPLMYRIMIINFMLLTAAAFYLVLRYRGEQLDEFARSFFEFSGDEIKLTISKVGELFSYIGSAMLIGTIINSQSHKYYEVTGVFGVSLICFFLYFVGCCFISAFLIKLAMILRNKKQHIYMFWMISAMAVSYYLYGVGFSMG